MLKKANRVLDKVESFLIISILASATILTFIQVIFRYGLNNSIYWAEEVILYLIICMSFVTTSAGIHRGAHISVDVLKSVVGNRYCKYLTIITSLLGVIFALVLIFFGGKLFWVTLHRGQLSPALRIPIAWMYAFIPITAMFQTSRYIEMLFSAWGKDDHSAGNEVRPA